MRAFLLVLPAVCLAVGTLAAVAVPGQGTDATAILAAAREALGGEQKLTAIRSFVATGRTRQVRGDNLVPIEFEISCELPDKYVRRDEIPAQESGATSSGFSGDSLIQIPPPPEAPPPGTKPPQPGGAAPGPGAARPAGTPPPAGAATPPAGAAAPPPTGAAATPPVGAAAPPAGAAVTPRTPATLPAGGPPPSGAAAAPPGRAGGPPGPPPDPRKARVNSIKQDFVRLTLGMFAGSFASYPLTFTRIGQAEAPQGTAEVLEAKGAGNFTVRLFISNQTHLPIMVSWTQPPTTVLMKVPGMPAPATVPPGAVVVEAPVPPGPTAAKEEQEKYAKEVQGLRAKAMAKPVEYRIYYADYREVDGGVKFPFRLRRAVGGETVEETNFDGFRINPRIDRRRFEAVK